MTLTNRYVCSTCQNRRPDSTKRNLLIQALKGGLSYPICEQIIITYHGSCPEKSPENRRDVMFLQKPQLPNLLKLPFLPIRANLKFRSRNDKWPSGRANIRTSRSSLSELSPAVIDQLPKPILESNFSKSARYIRSR